MYQTSSLICKRIVIWLRDSLSQSDILIIIHVHIFKFLNNFKAYKFICIKICLFVQDNLIHRNIIFYSLRQKKKKNFPARITYDRKTSDKHNGTLVQPGEISLFLSKPRHLKKFKIKFRENNPIWQDSFSFILRIRKWNVKRD